MNTLPFILLIVAVVVTALFFLYKILLKLTTKPVLEITLVPTENPRWSDKKKIAEWVDVFQKHGFEPAGYYECPEMPGVKISGFIKPSEQLFGVIYDHPIAGIWVDVCVEYGDGESLTVSSSPMGQELDHMPGAEKIYIKGSSPEGLIAKALAQRKNKARKTITKEMFSSHFEEAYKKEMKWRMERGGPTALEVKRVADEMGVPLDGAKMQAKTQELQKAWMKEKDKPRRVAREMFKAELPAEFQRPEIFRQIMEKKSEPMPRQTNIPVMPVYIVLIAAVGYWCYYGYQYTTLRGPVSLKEVIIFFAVLLVLFVVLAVLWGYNKQLEMCPYLKRIADVRPGAFLFISGTAPTLFYAREGWIGKLVFWMGGDSTPGTTTLEATTIGFGGWLSVSKKSAMSRFFGSDKDAIELPESDFSRTFVMSGSDKVLAEKLLQSGFDKLVMRLKEFEKPFIDIDGRSVQVRIDGELTSPRREAELKKFLEIAEDIVDMVARHG